MGLLLARVLVQRGRFIIVWQAHLFRAMQCRVAMHSLSMTIPAPRPALFLKRVLCVNSLTGCFTVVNSKAWHPKQGWNWLNITSCAFTVSMIITALVIVIESQCVPSPAVAKSTQSLYILTPLSMLMSMVLQVKQGPIKSLFQMVMPMLWVPVYSCWWWL